MSQESKKQTAVEWLIHELKSLGIYSLTLKEKCEQAKEMEKKEKERCWIAALEYGLKVLKTDENANSKEAFEQYYTQPYESNKMHDAKSMMSETQPSCLGAVSSRFNSDTFIDNVCLSYRHDFGLMAEQDRQMLRFECKEWMRAISNNWEYFKNGLQPATTAIFSTQKPQKMNTEKTSMKHSL